MPLVNPSVVRDMIGREVVLPASPQRIICLVPSLTELLYSLSLDDRVVGISKFCIYPKRWYTDKAKVGGTKKVNFSLIEQLKPDLIIANKEENDENDISELSQKYPVWVSDINSFDDALHAIEWIGEITQSEKQAKSLIFAIHKAWSDLNQYQSSSPSCAYLIWNDPIMAVGKDTYINDLIEKIQFNNVIKENRYPIISKEKLRELKPEYIFLSSEPFPFKKKHLEDFAKSQPDSKVILVDGEMFSWYGFRMKIAANYFVKLMQAIHNN